MKKRIGDKRIYVSLLGVKMTNVLLKYALLLRLGYFHERLQDLPTSNYTVLKTVETVIEDIQLMAEFQNCIEPAGS